MSTQRPILVGDVATPKVTVPNTGDETYQAPVTLNDAAGNEVAFDIEATVNKAAGNYTALNIDITETSAPGLGNRPFNIDVGGSSIFSIESDGTLRGSAPFSIEQLASSSSDQFQLGSNAYSMNGGAGNAKFLYLEADVATSGTGGVTGIALDMNETSLGSGAHNLMDLEWDSTGRFLVDKDGNVTSTGTFNGIDIATDVAANTAKVSYTDAALIASMNFVHQADNPGTDDNYFIGTGAGASWASGGVDNYAFGLNALDQLTTGDYNVAIGKDALTSLVTGSSNIAIGATALDSVTGSSNIAIGRLAGKDIVSGADNTIVGFNAGGTQTSSQGVFIGSNSDAKNASSYGAVAVGYGSKSANGGTSIGYSSNFAATGVNNTALGYQAGNSITTGTDNISIGYDADVLSATGVHQLAIGDAINGYMSALTDVDYSGNDLTITGPSALAGASVNQSGGALILRGGQKATGGGTSGDTIVESPYFRDGADVTKRVQLVLSGITTATDRTLTMPDANVDLTNVPNFSLTQDGNDNLLIGNTAGALIEAGAVDNTFVGNRSGDSVTTGDNNVFVGEGAGQTVSTGGYNVMIGKNTSGVVTSGSDNVFIGGLAGVSAGNGINHGIYIGSSSSSSGSNWLGPIAIGGNALATGNRTVTIGYDSEANTGSVSVGGLAGSGAAGDSYNVNIGYSANSSGTSCQRSICIGGFSELPSTTDLYQVAIGIGGTADPNAYALRGYTGALTDIDMSGKDLTLLGPSADKSASTNLDGGDLIIKGGASATTGIGVGGQVKIEGGDKGATGTIGGIEIGLAATSLIGLFGATPVAQQAGTGETTGFVAGAGTAVNDDSTFTGNVGSTAYRINDIVKALKNLGVLAA